MMNSSLTRVALVIWQGTSRSTVYLGGGISIWVSALMPMMGRLNRLSAIAIDRPPLECSRLWICSRRHSDRVRSSADTARSVCALIVSGLGNQEALPLRSMTVMSSDRNLPPCSRSSRSTVPVFPVSVKRREHDAGPVEFHARRVEQHPAAGDHDEPQQRLEDVGVHDVAGPCQQRPHVDRDAVADVGPEVGAEPAEVLLVADHRGVEWTRSWRRVCAAACSLRRRRGPRCPPRCRPPTARGRTQVPAA